VEIAFRFVFFCEIALFAIFIAIAVTDRYILFFKFLAVSVTAFIAIIIIAVKLILIIVFFRLLLPIIAAAVFFLLKKV